MENWSSLVKKKKKKKKKSYKNLKKNLKRSDISFFLSKIVQIN